MPLIDSPLRIVVLCLLLFGLSPAVAEPPAVFWPTPNGEYFQTGDLIDSLQPTASGRWESALFGCVRNGGTRFHEGVDLKPIGRDRHNEATDPIYSVMDGRVVYINRIAGNSGYGRYIVIEHESLDVPVYTLYAHLAAISPDIDTGTLVKGGQRIGTMGRSASYSIPRTRAHLHFEIGLRKSNRFQDYYDFKRYGGKNLHGDYNGINLTGMDPMIFFEQARTGKLQDMRSMIQGQPVAYTIRVATRSVPDFIARYPKLLTKHIPAQGLVGWEIDYTAEGMPIRWTPLTAEDVATRREGDITLVDYKPELLQGKCRKTIVIKGDRATLGSDLRNDLQLIFGFR